MRVVGLVSGGKDSVWNLHYCREFGHEIVCLANLAPPSGISELDSYMYQTVGFDLIDAVAQALGRPLVRRVIAGEARETAARAYRPSEGDEVEDLTLLLRDVLEAYPEVQAVSCGAILSNYQRIRVEHVCERLGLKVLAFMWMQDQSVLLRQMIQSGVDARIVKVASMGLEAKHVGKSILDTQFADYIFGLGSKWGVHVCGEGGEYETSVLDAPLYERAVRITESEVVSHADGGDVAYMRVAEATTEHKDEGVQLAPPFDALADYTSLRYYHESFPAEFVSDVGIEVSAASCEQPLLELSAARVSRSPKLQRVGSFMSSSSLDAIAFGLPLGGSAAEQCHELLLAVSTWLRDAHHLDLSDAAFAEVQVRDLGCFESVNAAYSQHFGSAPPARVCIETPLAEALHIRIRLLLRCKEDGGDARRFENLRVQSISTWAMACIGPYSQAFWVDSLLLSAGVLGLVPHSMTLPSPAQASAALGMTLTPAAWETELWMLMRSMRMVLAEMGCGFGDIGVAYVYVSAGFDPGAASARVLHYIRREAPEASPLIFEAVVPRLPKDGSVEVNVVCSPGGSEALHIFTRLAGAAGVEVAGSWRGLGMARVASASLTATRALVAEDLRACVAVLAESLAAQPERPAVSLQVQHVALGAENVLHAEILAAIEADACLRDRCAVSYMPVTSFGDGACLRLVAIASYG